MSAYVRTDYGNAKQMRDRANRVYLEKLKALMEQRNEIIGEAMAKHINVTMLFQCALQDLEKRRSR